MHASLSISHCWYSSISSEVISNNIKSWLPMKCSKLFIADRYFLAVPSFFADVSLSMTDCMKVKNGCIPVISCQCSNISSTYALSSSSRILFANLVSPASSHRTRLRIFITTSCLGFDAGGIMMTDLLASHSDGRILWLVVCWYDTRLWISWKNKAPSRPSSWEGRNFSLIDIPIAF